MPDEFGNPTYEGNVPYVVGDSCYLVKTDDFMKMLKVGMTIMKNSRQPMDDVYEEFPPGISFLGEEEEESGMILDGYFYSADWAKEIWVRYTTMEQMIDEGELNHSKIDGDVDGK